MFYSIIVFILGACIGSFLNVCIYRIPIGKSVVFPSSACPQCGALIKWYDNVPILGWIFLKAKCRNCGGKISARYMIVEALTGVIFLALWLLYDLSPVTACYMLSVSALIFASFVDIDEMWIPDRVTIGGIIICPVLSFFIPQLHGVSLRLDGLIASLIGLVFGFGLFWLIGTLGKLAFKKDALGFGDVKLMGALGALLGWQAVIFIMFVSALFGSVIGVTLILSNKKALQSRIPYGPYLALAAIIWMLGGYSLWDAYVALLH